MIRIERISERNDGYDATGTRWRWKGGDEDETSVHRRPAANNVHSARGTVRGRHGHRTGGRAPRLRRRENRTASSCAADRAIATVGGARERDAAAASYYLCLCTCASPRFLLHVIITHRRRRKRRRRPRQRPVTQTDDDPYSTRCHHTASTHAHTHNRRRGAVRWGRVV